MLQQYIQRLCADLELEESMPVGDKQNYVLDLNARLRLRFSLLGETIYLQGTVCPCPKEKREEIFIYLMRANLLGQGTGGAILSLDEKETNIRLNKALAPSIDYSSFKYAVEEFANYMDYWKEEVEKLQKQTYSPFR